MEIAYNLLNRHKVKEILIGPGKIYKSAIEPKTSFDIINGYATKHTNYRGYISHFFLGGIFGGKTEQQLYYVKDVKESTTISYTFESILWSKIKYVKINGEEIKNPKNGVTITLDKDYVIEVKFTYWPF